MAFVRHRIADVFAAVWALRALALVRDRLAAGELRGIALPAPSRVAHGGYQGVRVVLWRRGASCLESALIRQRFGIATGNPRDVVIGVRPPSEPFGAHAWLDGERDGERFNMRELTRVQPR